MQDKDKTKAELINELAELRQRVSELEVPEAEREPALRLEKILATMRLGVTITDPEGTITYVNPAEAAMHGYAVDELIGVPRQNLWVDRHADGWS